MPKLDYAYTDPSSFTTGQTPYGTYDSDSTFQTDIVLSLIHISEPTRP